ncbi:helix-turn-helix domain-containing protein [Lentibacillus sediminis]|uniref:helix-turn-helix domain-containing protein n=1 Tax=Lentibacillus sediminis TaxID=1940529 RepID=UPI000C1C7F8C|nr:helix-turn-helix domain-containing protein [Lentibacillus sediminis]
MYMSKQERAQMWESVEILSQIDEDKAKTIFKVTIEQTIQRFHIDSPIFSNVPLRFPDLKHLALLRETEEKMEQAFAKQERERAYEYLIEYVELISQLAEGDPVMWQKKILASLLAASKKSNWSITDEQIRESPVLYGQRETRFYTTNQTAKKLGLSDQTIRRMCENGKFTGAYKTEGGHWRIPGSEFITSDAQDKEAEEILKQIDKKNREAGDVDEFNL